MSSKHQKGQDIEINLGAEEDTYNSELEKISHQHAQHSVHQKQIFDLLSIHAAEFLVNRSGLGRVRFIVNLKTGQVAARKSGAKEWTKLETKYALRWLRTKGIEAVKPQKGIDYVFPQSFNLPSDEDQKIIRKLKFQARKKWFFRSNSQAFNAVFGPLGIFISVVVKYVFRLWVVALLVFGVYFFISWYFGVNHR
jgi:hypothetical protein